MFVSPFYKQVLAALRLEIGISFDDLARQVGLKRNHDRLTFALEDLAKSKLVKPITGSENTPRSAWLWKLGDPVAEPEPPRRGGRTPMGAPDYVYQPMPEETKAKLRAAHNRRNGTPEGFCRMYGELVPLVLQETVRRIVAKAVYQAKMREREKAKGRP